MITLGEVLCIKFIDSETTIIIYADKKIVFKGSYTELDNSYFSSFVTAFSYVTYKNLLKVAIL